MTELYSDAYRELHMLQAHLTYVQKKRLFALLESLEAERTLKASISEMKPRMIKRLYRLLKSRAREPNFAFWFQSFNGGVPIIFAKIILISSGMFLFGFIVLCISYRNDIMTSFAKQICH